LVVNDARFLLLPDRTSSNLAARAARRVRVTNGKETDSVEVSHLDDLSRVRKPSSMPSWECSAV